MRGVILDIFFEHNIGADLAHVQPPHVFNVPVPFGFPEPPEIIEFLKNRGVRFNRENIWRVDNERYRRDNKVYSVKIQCKIRPVLVLHGPEIISRGEFTDLPNWYQDSIICLPITRLKNEFLSDETASGIKNGRVPYIHYLHPKNKETTAGRLEKESIIIISRPVAVNKKYFTDFIGWIEEIDYDKILKKIKHIFNID